MSDDLLEDFLVGAEAIEINTQQGIYRFRCKICGWLGSIGDMIDSYGRVCGILHDIDGSIPLSFSRYCPNCKSLLLENPINAH